MASIDPTEETEEDDSKPARVPRSTLKLIKQRIEEGDLDSDDDEESDYLQALLNGEVDDDDSEGDDDDEPNGGPSDPTKSKKAMRAAAMEELLAAAKDDESDEEMADGEVAKKTKKANGKANGKGKEKATEAEEEESDEDESDDEDDELSHIDLEQFAVCTLDTERVSALIFPVVSFYWCARANKTLDLPAAYQPNYR